MKINERFIWALSVLSLSPDDNVLEIGCGNGILTEQIALQLKSGTITAIDRSKPSIKLPRLMSIYFGKAVIKILN
jgi:precorrin-6B methylase 2